MDNRQDVFKKNDISNLDINKTETKEIDKIIEEYKNKKDITGTINFTDVVNEHSVDIDTNNRADILKLKSLYESTNYSDKFFMGDKTGEVYVLNKSNNKGLYFGVLLTDLQSNILENL